MKNVMLIFILSFVCFNAWAQEAKKQVSIFVHASEFKTAVAEQVRSQLLDYDLSYYDIGKLLSTDTAQADIVLIINQTQWLKPNKDVIKYVKSLNDKEKRKVIVLSTAGTKGKNIKVPGVDAITAASEMNRVDELAQVIIDKIKAL